ncbi:RHS repeat-associated core domain-containing protein [Pseudomonas fluorescens]|uniref:RHS repeat-associated core domain-containing protein n=1 Tax=Pseudomonas fluorescens TaxID=294 RepID=A0A5E7S9R7_PSEFL|nr:RHS repeat-associated core domain-containing protein [Pseudomonas fluorescens]VVP82865.1 hypothetical protein PS928_00896 [Pseudomonas fluorescens]
MPTSTREILLGRYHYDPLDRLVDCTPLEQAAIQRYYCKTRLSTELQGTTQRSIVQHDDQLLAQQQHEGDKMTASLLATDQQRSVLNALNANQPHPLAYTPYGHRPPENALLSLLGFNGERPDPVTGHYHLGNGYRQFNPVLMRFNSPDSWSPFGDGGLNSYSYCKGEPVSHYDSTGHIRIRNPLKGLLNIFGRKPSPKTAGLKKIDKRYNEVMTQLEAYGKQHRKAAKEVKRYTHSEMPEAQHYVSGKQREMEIIANHTQPMRNEIKNLKILWRNTQTKNKNLDIKQVDAVLKDIRTPHTEYTPYTKYGYLKSKNHTETKKQLSSNQNVRSI